MIPVSFEFFPPKTPKGAASLMRTAERLGRWSPEYFSVTYGAGGSTRDGTRETVLALAAAGHPVAAHLSFGSDNEAAIGALIDDYLAHDVRRIVALRGDAGSGMGTGRYRYASDLVAFIRQRWGDAIHIEVAAYPEVHPDAPSPAADLEHFARKVKLGADGAITQYFYNISAYNDFVGRARATGVAVPITPGIMPITNHDNLMRFSAGCGAEVPRWVRLQLEGLRDQPQALKDFGFDVVRKLCQGLIAQQVPGMHFYTLNQAGPTERLLEAVAG